MNLGDIPRAMTRYKVQCCQIMIECMGILPQKGGDSTFLKLIIYKNDRMSGDLTTKQQGLHGVRSSRMTGFTGILPQYIGQFLFRELSHFQ